MRRRRRNKRRIKEEMELDITSLLDILVILLIFLLQSYNSSGLVFNVQKGIELPLSESKKVNTEGIIVQVSPTNITVDDIQVLDSNNRPRYLFDQGGRRIIPLYNALAKKREEINLLHRTVPQSKPFSGVVNFVIDKTIGYNYIKKLFYSAGEAGYKKFNLVVLGEQ